MSTTSIAVQTYRSIEEQFELRPVEPVQGLSEHDLLSRLHEYLASRVLQLMNSNFEQLMATLYRIDISEAAVKNVFKQTDELRIAGDLASLIIERQKQKAETRAAYKGDSQNG